VESHTVIAIDGPAASGKSSVARSLAKRLGYLYVNTGAMYRAVTWHVVRHRLSANDAAQVIDLLSRSEIVCGARDGESTFAIDGTEPVAELLSEEVNANVSTIARIAEVRARLVALQRTFADQYDLVMEGRDIGSAVFPETPFKFYIDASAEVRAQRRHRQGLLDPIAVRDRQDSSRHASPLIIAEDAHVIDSSNLTVDGVVGEIIGRLKMKGFPMPD
jgi:cytidylate kinase